MVPHYSISGSGSLNDASRLKTGASLLQLTVFLQNPSNQFGFSDVRDDVNGLEKMQCATFSVQ